MSFTQIPNDILFNSELNIYSRVLFGIILSLSRENGYCYASNEYLAERIGGTGRAVTNWILELKQMGEVMEVQDDFELLTWDLVSNPSNPDSWMKNGALNESRSTFLDLYSKTNSIITEILCAKGSCPIF